MVKRKLSKSDDLVKSRKSPINRHSGLSGIGSGQYVIRQYDSRQAGVTTFYDVINSTFPILIFVLILALPGCTYLKLVTTPPEKPTFTYRGAELVESTQNGVLMNFLFTAHNPNKAGLKNVTCSYELFMEEKKFMTGNEIPLTLNPKGDTEIKVPATIAYRDLFPVLGSVIRRMLSGEKTFPITINALFSGNPAILNEAGKEQPISFDWRLIKTADIPLQPERNK